MAEIYLAGPMSGCSKAEAMDWRYWVQNYLGSKPNVRANIPGIAEGIDSVARHTILDEAALKQVNLSMFDMALVNRSDVVIANLSYATRVSIGTVCEISWAYNSHKPVILIPDTKFHTHPILLNQATAVVYSIEDAVAMALNLVGY